MEYASICTGLPSTTIFWLDCCAVSAAPAAASSPATSDFTAFTGNLRRRGAYESLWTGSAPVLRR